MIFTASTYGQQSMDSFGFISNNLNNRFRLNGFETNTGNISQSKDWELSVVFSGYNTTEAAGNISSLSLSKRFDDHYLYARYTPGYIQQFKFNSGVNIVLKDSVEVATNLTTQLKYEEKFGFGYSFNFSKNFSAGITLRYFKQEFDEEKPDLFLSDTLNYLANTTFVTNSNFWRGDIGFSYSPNDIFTFSLSSINLISLEETQSNETSQNYSIKKEKGFIAGAILNPGSNFRITTLYENSNSFVVGANRAGKLFGGIFTYGASIFHDKYQSPYIAGVLPYINYSSDFFSVTLGGVKYFNDRRKTHLVSDFTGSGLHNIYNNKFSYDRLTLGVNIALSFIPEQSVKFIDVELKNEIYPTLAENYLRLPYAVGRVVNLTNKQITVKPASYIKQVNNEKILSPSIIVPPRDTVDVPFYTVINNEKPDILKREIGQANFYLSTDDNDEDDSYQKPILINDANSWDGSVVNLKYFVNRDLEFANRYAKNIIQENRNGQRIKYSDNEVINNVILLFNKFVKNMNYVADPRSSAEVVQFPSETLKLHGGDCDDLSVCFAAFLEGIGIQTAFVDYRDSTASHVNLIFNTNLDPDEMELLTKNDNKVIVRKNINGKDELWIPLETTSLTDFETAWSIAAEKFNKEGVEKLGLAKGSVVIVDIN